MIITIVQGAFLPIPPLLGGAVEKMWYSLAKEFVNNGHQVVYISKSYDGVLSIDNEDGIQHVRVKGYKTPKSGVILKILDLFYSLKAVKKIAVETNIIISNTFWLPLLLPKKQTKYCMVDVARMPKGQMRFYTNGCVLRANSTPVINAIKKEISSNYYKKVVMIPNPIPFKSDEGVDFSLKQKSILYTGRIHPEKGLDILINAFALLKNNDWKLLLVGPYSIDAGGGGKKYLDTLKALTNGTNVEFKEPIYDIKKLNQLYARASIFVYPSIAEKGETFGLSPLEAMSWGCATVVSDLECFKDFIKHDFNGLCFDHRSKNNVHNLKFCLDSLIQNPTLLNSFANQALQVQQSHSTEVLAQEFLKEFKKMIIR
jgi:glycosyltransferase involved in cell wall biosynthesis